MMKLKVQHVMDAAIVLTTIINDQLPMPQKGKYRIARMHAKLLPEFKIIDARRADMIKAYGVPQMRADKNEETGEVTLTSIPDQWQVPPEKMPEFTAAWKIVGDEEIDVDIEPIPLSSLSLSDSEDGAVAAHQLITLGELVSDT